MSNSHITVIQNFCNRMGIGGDRKIISNRGRVARVTGIEFSHDPKNQRVWIQLEDTPGNMLISVSKFNPIRTNEQSQA